MGKNVRRKRLLINPQFQAIFAMYAVVTTLAMVPLFMVANFYFFTLFKGKAASLGLPPEHELVQFAERQQTLMIAVFIGATLLAVAINLVISYVFSNRIAGSMYRLTTEFNQTQHLSQASPIQPRQKDYFTEVTEAYNRLLERSR